jgi:peptidoglycan/xylan/chitin deacetylase (PgdA/CDA1 family)
MPTSASVLLYHDVADRARAGDEAWTVTPATFASHVRVLAASGAPALRVRDIADHLRDRRAFPPRAFAVTFDDGYRSQVDAATALAEAGIPSTVYVTADFIGRPGYVDAPALAALAAVPLVTVGAHGTTHHHLDVLAAADMRADVDNSGDVLAAHLGRPVDAFAYPHGSVDATVRDHLAAGRWHSAAAVKNARTHPADDPFAFARITIGPATGADAVRELLDGRGAPLAWTRERARTTAFRQVRRLRHRRAHR